MMSIVITTRNDDHGGNLLSRLQTFIKVLAAYKKELIWNLELIIIEWNCIEDLPSLSELIKLPSEWVRVFQVPNEIHSQYDNSEAVPVFLQMGQNVGIRRAQGDWVLITNQDIVFSPNLARFLANENLDGQSFYRVQRNDTDVRQPPDVGVYELIELLKDRVIRLRAFREGKFLHTRSCGDFILMHRSAWDSIRGFPEFELFGTYIDGLVLHIALRHGLTQIVLDGSRCAYHIEHDNQTRDRVREMPNLDYIKEYMPLCDAILCGPLPLIFNDEAWGLGRHQSIKVSEGVWQLKGDENHDLRCCLR